MANLRFLADWTSVLTGDLAQGGKLEIEFDPRRLPQCRLNWRGAEVWDITGYARFHPSGEVFSGSLLQRIAPSGGIVTTLQPTPWEVPVPFDSAQVELWFHNFYQMSSRCDAWDSRFSQNYWFDVALHGPSQPVIYRAGASPRLDMVNAFDVTVMKRKHFFPGTGPGTSAGSEFQTVLTLKAWVRNVAYVKYVWVDAHVFDSADALVHAGTFGLQYLGGAGGHGDFFIYDDKIYQGSGGGSGMGAWTRPDARKVQFRLYYEVNSELFTDGLLHQHEVPADDSTH
jgi:hypothetical protein